MTNDLIEIFKEIKAILKKYENPMITKMNLDSRYELWSMKDIVINGKKKKEVYFGGIIIQSSYVGFYFMPVYVESEIKNMFGEKLLKLLKGKSCFHIKKLDEELKEQIDDALEKGYLLYKERGWV